MELMRFHNDSMPRFFDSFWLKEGAASSTSSTRKQPAVNIREMDTYFTLELLAPGFRKEDFTIKLDQNLLTISGQPEEKKEVKPEGKSLIEEFKGQKFSRSFRLSEEMIEAEKIEARYEAGILHILLPKKEQAPAPQPKKIAVLE